MWPQELRKSVELLPDQHTYCPQSHCRSSGIRAQARLQHAGPIRLGALLLSQHLQAVALSAESASLATTQQHTRDALGRGHGFLRLQPGGTSRNRIGTARVQNSLLARRLLIRPNANPSTHRPRIRRLASFAQIDHRCCTCCEHASGQTSGTRRKQDQEIGGLGGHGHLGRGGGSAHRITHCRRRAGLAEDEFSVLCESNAG